MIGAGLPRTGTLSLRAALNDLLDGAVYHMWQVAFGEKVDCTFWEKALKRKMTQGEWTDFLQGRGFRGGVDYPISLFYKYVVMFPGRPQDAPRTLQGRSLNALYTLPGCS